MKLRVSVKDGPSFVLNVGSGQQNLKWLAIVASQRKKQSSPRGRLRQREPHNAGTASLVPARVDTAATLEDITAPYSPSSRLKDVFRSGDEVFVTMLHSDKTNRWGMRLNNDWGAKAFMQSEASKGLQAAILAERAARAEKEELKQRKRMSAMIAEAAAGVVHNPDEMITPADLLAEDWAHITEHGLTGKLVRSAGALEDVQATLRANFQACRDCFRFFSNQIGSGSNLDSAFSMSLSEFLSFMVECGVKVRKLSPSKLYAAAATGVLPWNNPSLPRGIQLQRAHFVDAVCCLAAAVAADDAVLGLGGDAGFPLTPIMLDTFLQTYVVPRAKAVSSTSTVLDLMKSDDAMAFMAAPKTQSILRLVFDMFSDDLGIMDQHKFLDCMSLCGMLACGSLKLSDSMQNILEKWEEVGDVLTTKEGLLAFHLSQSKDSVSSSDAAQAGLDLSEFVVCCGHVSILKWEEDDRTFTAKLQLLFQHFERFLRKASKGKGMVPAGAGA